METPELIFAAQTGNYQALNKLIWGYQDTIYSLGYYLCPDQDAETLMQAAIRRIYQDLPSYRGDDFRLWLIKTVVKVCRRAVHLNPFKITHGRNGEKAQKSFPEISLQLSQLNPATNEFLDIRQYLFDLQPELRIVLVLIDLEKMDYMQTAAVLGVPVGIIRKRLAKARWHLSNQLRVLQWEQQHEA